MSKEYDRHELSAAFPEMSAEDSTDLRESILEVGKIVDPIVVFEGQILDGWNRYQQGRAIKATEPHMANLLLPMVEFNGGYVDAYHYARAKNGARRNMDKGQKILAIVRLRELVAAKGAPGAHLPTAREEAQEAGVSVRTVRQAQRVVRNAAPELVNAVQAGNVSLKEAAAAVDLPKAAQRELAATPKPPRRTSVATPRDTSDREPSPGAKWKPIKPQIGATAEAVEELKERIGILTEENDRLTERLALHFMEGTDDEKAAAAQLVADLRRQVVDLEYQLETIADSRDHYQREAAELKTQCGIYRSQLAKKS